MKIPKGYSLIQRSCGITLKEEDIIVTNVKIDLTRGRENPLERYIEEYFNVGLHDLMMDL